MFCFVEFLPVYVHFSGGSIAFFKFSKGSVTQKRLRNTGQCLGAASQYLDGFLESISRNSDIILTVIAASSDGVRHTLMDDY